MRHLKNRVPVRMMLEAIGVGLVTCSVATVASSQEPEVKEATGLGEILVTAQRREQSLNDVGIAATVLGAQAIRELGLDESYDIAAYTPGLNMVAAAGYSGKINFTLRGVGLNSYSEEQEAAVAVYQDEVYLAPLVGSIIGGFDLERIEVLRGPQGTLFGRSATGGLVHYISKRPTREHEGSLNVAYGSYDERHGEAAFGVPLGGKASARLSGYWNEYDGWLENNIGEDRYGERRWAARGQLLFELSDSATLLLKGEYGELENPGGVTYLGPNVYRTPDGVIRDLPANVDAYGTGPGNDYTGFRDTDGEFFTSSWGQDGTDKAYNDVDRGLYSAILTWDLGSVTLTSVTGYLEANKDYFDDIDANPTDYIHVFQLPRHEQLVQELRFAGGSDTLRWVVGGFYFNWDEHNEGFGIDMPSGFIPPFGGSFALPLNFYSTFDQSKESIAGFGQLEYAFTDRVTGILGLRYEQEETEVAVDMFRNAVAEAFVGPGVPFNSTLNGDLARIDADYVSGTVQLNWAPSDNVLFYTSLRRGIKPGAFNAPLLPLPPEGMKVKEEKLHALEIGSKATLFDSRVQANTAAYYYDYEDLQAVFLEGVNVLLTNADAEVYGLDLDVMARVGERFTLGLAASVLEGTVKDIPLARPGPGDVIVRDREMTNAPKYSVSALARYEWSALGGMMSLQSDVSWRGETYFEIQNHPAQTGAAYAVGNVRAAWQNDNFEIAATVRNLWEEEYTIFAVETVDLGGFNIVTPSKPRWWGLEMRYSWGGG